MLGLNRGNSKLIDFICSEKEEEMMQDNSLLIHVETGNAFTTTLTLMKAFMIFCSHNKTKTKN